MTLAEVKAAVHELDPVLVDEDDETFRIAVLLIASIEIGTDPMALAAFTGYHVEWIALVGSRWMGNGVWTVDGGVAGAEWLEEETGGIAFWLDVAVGGGFVDRVEGTKWQESPS